MTSDDVKLGREMGVRIEPEVCETMDDFDRIQIARLRHELLVACQRGDKAMRQLHLTRLVAFAFGFALVLVLAFGRN